MAPYGKSREARVKSVELLLCWFLYRRTVRCWADCFSSLSGALRSFPHEGCREVEGDSGTQTTVKNLVYSSVISFSTILVLTAGV